MNIYKKQMQCNYVPGQENICQFTALDIDLYTFSP